MVYLRLKKVKGQNYLYLVRSVWNSKKNTSKQEVIKYLGKASEAKVHDIPPDYRNDSKILAFIASINPEKKKEKQRTINRHQKEMYKCCIKGDLDRAVKSFDEYHKLFSTGDFFDNVLKPVMYKIGKHWETGKISIAEEHVSSNTAHGLVKILLERKPDSGKRRKVLICTPYGEEHNLGCNVIESYLSCKGFKILNASGSQPHDSILDYINYTRPDVILISVTLEDNIKSCQRLVRKIRERFNVPILVGGFAIEEGNITKMQDVRIIKNILLEKFPKIIRSA